jgi:hypothetical protein
LASTIGSASSWPTSSTTSVRSFGALRSAGICQHRQAGRVRHVACRPFCRPGSIGPLAGAVAGGERPVRMLRSPVATERRRLTGRAPRYPCKQAPACNEKCRLQFRDESNSCSKRSVPATRLQLAPARPARGARASGPCRSAAWECP